MQAPLKMFNFLLLIAVYLFATLIFFYKVTPKIFDNPSDLELIVGVFLVAVWVILTACIGAWFAMGNQIASGCEKANRTTEKSSVVANWTDKQVLDFCSVALRHVVVEGDLKFSDINDGLRYMADKGEPAFLHAFSIDDHVKLVANARRYEWLRDGALGTGSANVPMVRIGSGDPVGGKDLDAAVDAAKLDWPIDEDWPREQQP
ncbi:hypothetical protein [Pseudomonas sp. MRSN 12121]|uniref:hypothetical protein n=1 Tax=Pseudomonas sp. MRSN 12121 TaxID=1611770 RepID=UPI000697F5AA|nr:hypothetical protein [Pseudomonas sp. MRSN 12121]